MEEKELEKNVVETAEDIKLADNAYRELKEGEHYKPILLGERSIPN